MSELHEHLEHAEHAEHASSSFDRMVAMTIAVIAAALAGVSVLGHRAHNEVLSLQSESNRLRTEGAAAQVETSNQFAWYQAKRQRQAQAEAFLKLTSLMPDAPGKETARHAAEAKWTKDVAKYEEELPAMEKKGKDLAKKADDLEHQAKEKLHQSHFVHRQADRLDIGHLAVELGLVLGSIAILTKRKAFWIAGIACSLIGVAVTGSAYLLEPQHHEESPGHVEESKEAKPSSGGGH